MGPPNSVASTSSSSSPVADDIALNSSTLDTTRVPYASTRKASFTNILLLRYPDTLVNLLSENIWRCDWKLKKKNKIKSQKKSRAHLVYFSERGRGRSIGCPSIKLVADFFYRPIAIVYTALFTKRAMYRWQHRLDTFTDCRICNKSSASLKVRINCY